MLPFRRADEMDEPFGARTHDEPFGARTHFIPVSADRHKRRTIQDEEASKRIRWSEALLSRRPSFSEKVTQSPEAAPCEPTIEPQLSVQTRNFVRGFVRGSVEEEETTPPPTKHSDGLPKENALPCVSPPCLGRSSSIMNAAAALLDASRDAAIIDVDAGARPRTARRLKMRTDEGRNKLARRRKKPRAAQSTMRVAGVDVTPLSDATLQQLQLLSGAFRLRPQPSSNDLVIIAQHVGVAPEQLAIWFESRRTLQSWWTRQQPHLQPSDLVNLFYPHHETSERRASILGNF